MKISNIATVYYRIKFIKEFITIKKFANNSGKIITDKDILKKLYNIHRKNSIKTGFNMGTFEIFYSDFKYNKNKIKKLYER